MTLEQELVLITAADAELDGDGRFVVYAHDPDFVNPLYPESRGGSMCLNYTFRRAKAFRFVDAHPEFVLSVVDGDTGAVLSASVGAPGGTKR
ncbi:hypothetical protein GCM10022286_05730 [Gryllotalpicola daejeonensis]|uniref:Uncharacterized protein n=1 Tax=Gryllotalpicola daejeonensis TaxID=993087 RepID=A0ABP7ZFB9_9MICO